MWNEDFANVKEKYISKPLTSLTQTVIELGSEVGSPYQLSGVEDRDRGGSCCNVVPSRRFGAGKGPDVVRVTDLDPPH